MQEDKTGLFINCRTCGKYIPEEDAFKKHFCSVQCSKSYRQCSNCGKYFIGDTEFCSHECSADFKNKEKIKQYKEE